LGRRSARYLDASADDHKKPHSFVPDGTNPFLVITGISIGRRGSPNRYEQMTRSQVRSSLPTLTLRAETIALTLRPISLFATRDPSVCLFRRKSI